ncbi:hypothetical protein JQ571_02980 [Bradyrhizobium liaoningense]|nr:hypothetical protein [Bradyrhizobium liaoningense]MBR1165922.1 hypothetical protein [Bradyrhizobium liaoningense]
MFLPSYPTVNSGPLHGAACLYDNAVAAIALVGCGEQDKARRIGAAILWAIDNDRSWHDGRLRNAYGEDRDGVWTEGTSQMALLLKLLGRTAEAKSLVAVIESQRSPDGGFYATSVRALPTGFMLDTDPAKPRLYFRLPHLGAASWAALAERGFNPFTATKGLP